VVILVGYYLRAESHLWVDEHARVDEVDLDKVVSNEYFIGLRAVGILEKTPLVTVDDRRP